MTDEPADEPGGVRDQLRQEAATWFARMRGEDADQHRAAFERWLARGAVHRSAYNRIGEVFAAGKGLRAGTEETFAASGAPGRGPRATALVAASACAMMALPLLLWHGVRDRVSQPAAATLAASTNQRMTTDRVTRFRLANGASVVLDIDSLLVTRVGGVASAYRLTRGRARFEVPGGRGAQQIVLAGPGVVTSAGGIFDLWVRSDGSLDAQALMGRVSLRAAVSESYAGAPQTTVGVLPGQHCRMTSLGRASILPEGLGRDWPRGILEFRGTPLADVVEEANRYGPVKILLEDASLGQVRVSGRFRVDDPLRLAERLAIVLALRLDRRGPGLVILRRQEKS